MVSSKRVDNAIIATTIKAKEKLDELIKLFNRNSSKQLNVYSAINTQASLEAPLVFSPATIKSELDKLKATMSPDLRKIIFENGMTSLNKISENDIRSYGSKISGLYDLAIRYELLAKNKKHYIEISNKDVRGYYYLQIKKLDAQKLKDFNSFDKKTQNEISEALLGICKNDKVKTSSCQKEIQKAINNNSVDAVYSRYINSAIINWNSFFVIPSSAVRSDVSFRRGVLEIPFAMPADKETQDFIRTIESFWKTQNFEVVLDLQNKKKIPNLELKENSIAHVNKLGGNNIVMNKASNMNSKTAQYTLSHEFGHVLGLPDCYIEFYDEEKEAFVNYQLLKSDMMCSASGKLTPRIIQELEKIYGS